MRPHDQIVALCLGMTRVSVNLDWARRSWVRTLPGVEDFRGQRASLIANEHALYAQNKAGLSKMAIRHTKRAPYRDLSETHAPSAKQTLF